MKERKAVMAERDFFEVMKELVAGIVPGLQNAAKEVGAELTRMGKQGAAEIAAALFGSSAYVQYGDGQRAPQVGKDSPEQEVQKAEPQPEAQKEPERYRGGREM